MPYRQVRAQNTITSVVASRGVRIIRINNRTCRTGYRKAYIERTTGCAVIITVKLIAEQVRNIILEREHIAARRKRRLNHRNLLSRRIQFVHRIAIGVENHVAISVGFDFIYFFLRYIAVFVRDRLGPLDRITIVVNLVESNGKNICSHGIFVVNTCGQIDFLILIIQTDIKRGKNFRTIKQQGPIRDIENTLALTPFFLVQLIQYFQNCRSITGLIFTFRFCGRTNNRLVHVLDRGSQLFREHHFTEREMYLGRSFAVAKIITIEQRCLRFGPNRNIIGIIIIVVIQYGYIIEVRVNTGNSWGSVVVRKCDRAAINLGPLRHLSLRINGTNPKIRPNENHVTVGVKRNTAGKLIPGQGLIHRISSLLFFIQINIFDTELTAVFTINTNHSNRFDRK